ncbi:hypothetical protein NUU61_001392 [Penicillium alfredii]|uniref:Uncharacterized protein n=1 Tax=Penicillium alfredii TaxID=1506179 RepID=A0A9W9G4C5_9EURO|nr:uncharacterized protein NUU61_001392 [Penicillium alfredii]KAJ5111762.1 hypothetical protein NUU61_001392 [Penicillium alfredii]
MVELHARTITFWSNLFRAEQIGLKWYSVWGSSDPGQASGRRRDGDGNRGFGGFEGGTKGGFKGGFGEHRRQFERRFEEGPAGGSAADS